jgi:hypothetical protein
VTFEGDVQPFVQIIKAGEILHVGKGTAFGLGRYEVSESRTGRKQMVGRTIL